MPISVSPLRRTVPVLIALGLVVSGCGGSSSVATTEPTQARGAEVQLANPTEVYDPVRAGEPSPVSSTIAPSSWSSTTVA